MTLTGNHNTHIDPLVLELANQDPVNLALLCLALSRQHPVKMQAGRRSIEIYRHHLEKLGRQVGEKHRELLAAETGNSVQTQLATLKYILCDQEGYELLTPDQYGTRYNPQGADIIQAIETRKAGAFILCALYQQVACDQGWTCDIINIPGHPLCRLEKDGQRLIFDPAASCQIMSAPDLRALVKTIQGASAELSADYYAPLSAQDILLYLYNPLKLDYIEYEDYEAALNLIENLQIIIPGEYKLYFDAGILYARTGATTRAIEALKTYIQRTPRGISTQDARTILYELENNPA